MSRQTAEAIRIAQIEAIKSIAHDLEPLLVIGGGLTVLGVLEHTRIDNERLISTDQKDVALAGLIAIEVARSGMIQQTASVMSTLFGAISKAIPLLAAAG